MLKCNYDVERYYYAPSRKSPIVALDDHWLLTPQAQLTYAALDLDGNASLHRQFLGRARWSVSGERFTTAKENVWAEIGAGGTYNWNDGRYGMFAKLAAQSTLEQFAENYTISGNIAFKVKW
ncbi:hypothetical protein ATN84_10675 [Paramesorhizobium deserti]|uniref:Autotransporter domain-containing protein n=1 Tax=Paramesorhizobium deserti TaxID=1494590 RepID=A0A135HTK5_9HYPH|nr:hypothetical protein ATN84_10675 [Paramesorhizobium deserti]